MLFITASNEEIGEFIKNRIAEKYKSTRDFCQKYLEMKQISPDKDVIDKMANRISQIKLGKRGIQIDDLGYFTELLGVTCEEILSAGRYKIANYNKYTNYSFAASKNEQFWEKYISRDYNIILNTDEYGKTVLDYAFEFKNYELLKYLINKKYIQFDEKTFSVVMKFKGTGGFPFGITPYETNWVRTDLITLAIENKDIETLEYFHARETNHMLSAWGNSDYEEFCNEKMLACISKADNSIVQYFSEPFSVKEGNREAEFVFPFIGRLIDIMIKNNSKNLETILKKAVKHNEKIYEQLKLMLNAEFHSYYKLRSEIVTDIPEDNPYSAKNTALDAVANYFRMNSSGIFWYHNSYPELSYMKLIANIIQVREKTKDSKLNKLIDKLNEIYTDISTVNKEKMLMLNKN